MDLANILEHKDLVLAILDGRKLQCRVKPCHYIAHTADDDYKEWTLWDGRFPSLINPMMEFRVQPEPKWRPWTKDEVPKFFMARYKTSGGRAPFVVTLGSTVPGFDMESPIQRFPILSAFDRLIWIHEDGSETPCGVLECPGSP